MAPPPSYGTIDLDYAGRLLGLAPEDDGPAYMVNLMRYRERAVYADGTDGGASGQEADDRYAPVEVLGAIGATVVLFADVEEQLGAEPAWHRVGIVRYPSRRAFLAMQDRPDFQAQHVHKEAGMEQTIVSVCTPAGGELPLAERGGTGPIVLRVVPAGATDAGATDAGATDAVTSSAGGAVVLEVEGTIIGDGRAWSAYRFEAGGAAEGPLADPGDGGFALRLRPTIDVLTGAGTTTS